METHTVVETIRMADGSLKDFAWTNDDWNAIGLYWEDRGDNNHVKVAIDGREVSLEEADKIILAWEEELQPMYCPNLEDSRS